MYLSKLREALASLPRTLDETYTRILDGIPDDHKQEANRILQFLLFSKRPLRIEEAVDAIAVDPEGDPHFDPKKTGCLIHGRSRDTAQALWPWWKLRILVLFNWRIPPSRNI